MRKVAIVPEKHLPVETGGKECMHVTMFVLPALMVDVTATESSSVRSRRINIEIDNYGISLYLQTWAPAGVRPGMSSCTWREIHVCIYTGVSHISQKL